MLLDENWYMTHFDSRPALSTRQGLFTACFPRIRTRHVTSPIKFRQPTNPLLHSSTFFRRERRSLCGKLVRRPPKVLKAGILVPSSAGNCMHNRALIHVFNGWSRANRLAARIIWERGLPYMTSTRVFEGEQKMPTKNV